MIKKYLQLLLSVNFCLTAISVANPSDSDDYDSFLLDNHEDRETTLSNQCRHIWNGLDNIYRMYRYKSLQTLLLKHEETSFQYDDEIPESEIEEKVAHQLKQISDVKNRLHTLISHESGYQPPERAAESEFTNQLENIQDDLSEIIEAYKAGVYSKKDKAFLNNELEQFTAFFEKLISKISNHDTLFAFEDSNEPLISTNPYTFEVYENTIDTGDVRALLESCQEEDASIYAQYETVLNGTFKEIEVKDFLTDSQADKNTFMFFNKDENLIEIKHMQDGENLCTTIWQIRPSDAHKVKWKLNDKIHINETGLFTKYSIYGERLDYNLGNKKSSVRANLICKSAPENTYHILGIDYLKKIVLLDNGLCLFVLDSPLEGWHTNDKVFLDIYGPSINPNGTHGLLNASRNKRIFVSLTNKPHLMQ